MPILAKIQFPEGRDPEAARRVMTHVAQALCDALDEKPENVRVTVKIVPACRYSVGGVLMNETGTQSQS